MTFTGSIQKRGQCQDRRFIKGSIPFPGTNTNIMETRILTKKETQQRKKFIKGFKGIRQTTESLESKMKSDIKEFKEFYHAKHPLQNP